MLMEPFRHHPTEMNGRAPWRGDYIERRTSLPGGALLDVTGFPRADAQTVTAAAAVAANDTTVTVDPLEYDLRANTLISFSGGTTVRLTKRAMAGDEELQIAASPGIVALGETADLLGSGAVYVPSGTLVGRTLVDRDADPPAPFGAADPANDDEIYLLLHDVYTHQDEVEVELYRHNALVKENFLPDWANWSAAAKTALRARYECTIGQP